MSDDVANLLTVTIPTPSYIPRSRGVYAVNKFDETPMKVLCNHEERKIIDQACQKLGISRSNFGRWCMFHVAVKVLENGE